MNKTISVLLLLIFSHIYCQSSQFIYEYKFVKDSTDQKNVSKEIMLLNINKNKSEYFSAEKFASDSILDEQAKKGILGMPPNKDMITDRIVKNLSDKTLQHITVLFSTRYTVSQTVAHNWTILPEVSTLLNHKVQKATTNFGGRKWTAWFTSEIPISDGPYKFFGLPGLIMKIEDSQQNHVITLVGVKKLFNIFVYPELKNYSTEISTNYDTFKKTLQNYRKDPVADQIGKIPDQTDASGNFRTGEEILRNSRKIMLERIKKDNNFLELDLLK